MASIRSSWTPQPLAARRSPPRRQGGTRRGRVLVLFAAPAVIWYLIFTIGPLVSMFWISLLDWPGLLEQSTFVGTDGFAEVLGDHVFWEATRNTAVQLAITVPVLVVSGFLLGYYLSLRPRGHQVLRVLLFTPSLMSLATMGTLFIAVLGPTGLLNGALEVIGLGGKARPWLAGQPSALLSIVGVNLWSSIGFTAVLFAARLASVSPEIYDAADLDGAGHWRKMWRIAFPVIRDYVGVLTMLQFLWTLFYSAALVLLMTGGGPGNSSTTLSFLIYDKAFVESDIGYSQAVGVLLFAVGVAGMLLIRRAFRPSF